MPFPTGNWWSESPDARPLPPDDAAQILRQHFGFDDPNRPGTFVGDPSGALELGRRRDSLKSELEDRIANEAFGAAMGPQTGGFEADRPGVRSLPRNLPAANLASDRVRLAQLQGDITSDPFTGTAEHGRVGKIQQALDDAATIQRPEIGDAATTLAKRNEFAEYMKAHGMKFGEKMGEYEAAGSPAAYAAGMTPIRVAGSAESQDVLNAANQRAMALANVKKPGVKYTATEQQMLDAANTVQELGPKLLALLEEENPGIGQDPTKYGSWFDKISGSLGGWVYRQGKTKTARTDEIDQLVGYLGSAVPRMLVPGRVNQTQYNDLKNHAPELGFSDGANYERMHKLLTVILPDVMRGVDAAHGATPTSTQLPGEDENKYAPPSDEQLGIPSPYAINR